MYKKIIIGAGLGGLIHGILHKMARPDDEVVIYDGNRIPGGFCTAFQKHTTYQNEKITYTVNIPLITSDFQPGDPLANLLDYMGVKNLKWKVIDNLFEYYPLNEEPFVLRGKDPESLANLASSLKEKANVMKFFAMMKKFYNDLMDKCHLFPNPIEAIGMLCRTPSTIIKILTDGTYLKTIDKIGIKTQTIREILCAAEAFLGVEADLVSSAAELSMIQSFLQNTSLQPTDGDTFQTLSDNLAERFKELGGKLELQTRVKKITFQGKKATGVIVGNESITADSVVIATAQDVIAPLIEDGAYIPAIKKRLKKIEKLPPPNSDYYSYFLIDKKAIEEKPELLNTAYHIYKLPENNEIDNWKLPVWVPNELINDKYYVLTMVITEKDQAKIDEWVKLRDTNLQKYTEEKEKMAQKFIKTLQDVEPLFVKYPPLKHLMTMSPASYNPYGSKYPLSGLAPVPENFLLNRMTPVMLDNLFLSGNSNFCCGVWGAMAGAWQSFVCAYEKEFGVKIGNHDILYKSTLKNLPAKR